MLHGLHFRGIFVLLPFGLVKQPSRPVLDFFIEAVILLYPKLAQIS